MQLPLDPLKLLMGFNYGEWHRINVHEEELLVARVWSLRTKSGQYRRFYIGVLALS
jgi:hypothetical protein